MIDVRRILCCVWLAVSFSYLTAWPAEQDTIVVTVHLEDLSPAETIYVDVNNASGIEDGTIVNPFNTIGEAIAATSFGRGDTVIVLPGFYFDNIVLEDNLSLVARDGSFHTFIMDAGGGTVVTLAADSTLRGFSVGDGSVSAVDVPAGIVAEVTNCVLFNSDIGLSAGAGATLAFINNTVDGNTSFGLHGESDAIFDVFKNNVLTVNGTGVFSDANAIANGGFNLFFGNSTNYDGSAAALTDFTDDPLYVDPGVLNFHLGALSPARDAGDPDPAFDDLDGTRNDLGADGGPQGVQDLLAPLCMAMVTPMIGDSPLTVMFDGSASTDEWGIASYCWDLDSVDGDGDCDIAGPIAEHTYVIPGMYIATLTVTDNNGIQSKCTVEIVVGNNLPSASASADPQAGAAPLEVMFSGTGSDPDGGAVSFAWDFDNGDSSTQQSPTYVYPADSEPRSYVVQLVVTDDEETSTVAQVAITVTDQPVEMSQLVPEDTGGLVTIDDPDSPLDGMQVSIPAGAISEDIVVTIGQVLNPPPPPPLSFGIAVDLGPSGFIFTEPVTVSIPHSEFLVHEETIVVQFFDESTGLWSSAGINNVQHFDGSPVHIVRFDTTHFSTFTAVSVAATSSGEGGGGGGCFIAAAAYGTPMADDIGVLRAVRDDYLLSTPLGMLFVDMYYRVSSPIADVVAQSPALAALIRLLFVPVIVLANLSLTHPLAFALALLSLCAITAYRRFYRASSATK